MAQNNGNPPFEEEESANHPKTPTKASGASRVPPLEMISTEYDADSPRSPNDTPRTPGMFDGALSPLDWKDRRQGRHKKTYSLFLLIELVLLPVSACT